MPANTAKPHSISKDLVLRATRGLISHLSKASSTTNKSLLDEEGVTDYVMASFQLQKIPAQGSPKPIRIEVPHRVMTGESADDDTFEVCLIVKDESKAWVKALIESTPSISYVTKVLTLSKLRSDYSTFQQRRELLASYDFFLADDRILPMIGSKLGKNFFQAKKQPIAVKLTRKESLPLTISKALESTYLFISTGPCLTVKCGRAGVLSEKKLVENVLAVVENCVKKIPGKWGNIREIGIRCGQSATVPVYARTTAQLRDIEGLGKSSVSGVGVVETNLEVEEKIAKKKEVEKKKSKSPLLNALKKKKEEKQEEILEEEKTENRKAKRAKKQPEERPPVKEKKVTKKRKGSVEKEVEEEEEVEKVSPKKKTKKAAVEEKKVEKKVEKKAEKKVKAVVKEVSEDLDESFISKKKFTGRKPGFVFKKGKKGLGYYKDEIPKVDSAFLEQLQRQAGGGRRGGGGRKGGRKGRR